MQYSVCPFELLQLSVGFGVRLIMVHQKSGFFTTSDFFFSVKIKPIHFLSLSVNDIVWV